MELTKDDANSIIERKLREITKKYGEDVKLDVLELLTIQSNANSSRATRYIPISKWIDYHPYPTAAGIRGLIARKEINDCLVRSGKRILIDEVKMLNWISRKRGYKENDY